MNAVGMAPGARESLILKLYTLPRLMSASHRLDGVIKEGRHFDIGMNGKVLTDMSTGFTTVFLKQKRSLNSATWRARPPSHGLRICGAIWVLEYTRYACSASVQCIDATDFASCVQASTRF